jgi:SAM-dependent methyltransferase
MPYWTVEDFGKLYGSGYFIPDSPRWAHIRAHVNPLSRWKRIQSILQSSETTALEVGSGIYAHFCQLLASKGWSTIAQEPSTSFGKELRGKGLEVESRPFEELPEDRKFAIIYADSVFEHVAEPAVYFAKAARLLEPGGVLFLVVPRERSFFWNCKYLASRILNRPSPFLSAYKPPYHLHGYSPESIARFAQSSGLTLALVYCREDWFWLQALERLPFGIGHLAAAVFWMADRLGLGGNLEVGLTKAK